MHLTDKVERVDAMEDPFTCVWHEGKMVLVVVKDVVRLSMCKTVANAMSMSKGGTLCKSQKGKTSMRKNNSVMCGLRSACIKKGRECGPYEAWINLNKRVKRNVKRITNQVVARATKVLPELKSSLAASSFRAARCTLPPPEFGCGQYYACACFRSAKGIKPAKHVDDSDVGLSCIITLSPKKKTGETIKTFSLYIGQEPKQREIKIIVPNGSAIFVDSRKYEHSAKADFGTYTMVLYNKESLMDTTYKLVK